MHTIQVPHGHFLSPDACLHAFTSRSMFFPNVYLSLIVRLRDKPPVYNAGECNPEWEVTKCPHDACSQLLILQGREPTWRSGQVDIRSIERRLGKSEQRCQDNVLGYSDSHAHHLPNVARARAERWRWYHLRPEKDAHC